MLSEDMSGEKKPVVNRITNDGQSKEVVNEAKDNKNLSFHELKRIFMKVGFFQLNLALVYFFEYMCLTCFADRIMSRINQENPDKKEEFLFKQGYVVFAFCYQIGVFISRSSLSLLKIPKVQIMTILQLLNFLFFLLNTIFLFLDNFYAMFAIMVWVGLMGGSSYVNVMYQILESPELAKNEKELALTLTTICNDIGILTASLLSLLLTNTAFKTN